MTKSDLIYVSCIVIFWTIVWIAFRSIEKYPNHDDFIYGRSAKIFTDSSEIVRIRAGTPDVDGKVAAGASSIFQTVVSGTLCKFFGFSYDRLIFHVWLQNQFGVLSVYGISRLFNGSAFRSFFLSLLTATCPFVLGHSFTFMTDGVALAWNFIAIYAALAGILRKNIYLTIVGVVCCSFAVLCRQTGIFILAIPVGVLLLESIGRGEWKSGLIRSIAFAVVPLFCLFGLQHVLFDRANLPSITSNNPMILQENAYRLLTLNAYHAALILGWFLLPLLPYMFLKTKSVVTKSIESGFVSKSILALFWIFPATLLILKPGIYITNATGYFVQNGHFGPILLSDAYDPGLWGDMGAVEWNPIVWQTLTYFSLVSALSFAFYVAGRVFQILKTKPMNVYDSSFIAGVLVLAAAVVALCSMPFAMFDRYWMTCYPILILLVSVLQNSGDADECAAIERTNLPPPSYKKMGRIAFVTGIWLPLFFQTYLSIVYTHDMLVFNEARWKLFERKLQDVQKPELIDGGYAVNGWYRSESDSDLGSSNEKSGVWWNRDAVYFLAIAPRDGMSVVDEEPWTNRSAWASRKILLLKKDDD